MPHAWTNQYGMKKWMVASLMLLLVPVTMTGQEMVGQGVVDQEVAPQTVVVRVSNERTVSGRVYVDCQRRARRVGTFYEESVTTVRIPVVALCERGSLVFQFRGGRYVAFDTRPLRKMDLAGDLAGMLVCLREGDDHALWAGETREVPWSCPES